MVGRLLLLRSYSVPCPLRTGVLILALTPRATYSTSKAFLHGLQKLVYFQVIKLIVFEA